MLAASDLEAKKTRLAAELANGRLAMTLPKSDHYLNAVAGWQRDLEVVFGSWGCVAGFLPSVMRSGYSGRKGGVIEELRKPIQT